MEFGDGDHLRERLDQLVDHAVGDLPPRRLVKLLFALTGKQSVLESLGSVTFAESSTAWQLFALTAKRLIIVEGDAKVVGWTWDSTPPDDARETARSLSLADIRSIEIKALREQRLGNADPGSWISDYSIDLGGELIPLPKATTLGEPAQRERIESFAGKLIELTT
jgi:hypothetical protein